MKNWIQMYKGISGNDNPIYSSVKRVVTEFGSMFQGTPRGQKTGLPWFISITELDEADCPAIIWANTQNGDWLTVDEYKAKYLDSSQSDDDHTSDQPNVPN